MGKIHSYGPLAGSQIYIPIVHIDLYTNRKFIYQSIQVLAQSSRPSAELGELTLFLSRLSNSVHQPHTPCLGPRPPKVN